MATNLEMDEGAFSRFWWTSPTNWRSRGRFLGAFYRRAPSNTQLLVRALHVNRRVLAAGKKMQLQQTAPDFPKVGNLEVAVCRKPGQAERIAHIEVHLGQVICPPANNRRMGKSVVMSVIWAKETRPPADVEPLEWYLLTTCQIDTFEQANEMIRYDFIPCVGRLSAFIMCSSKG